jgi:hypothetical protein
MGEKSHAVDVSVILTSWNGREVLRSALLSVRENTLGLTYEIIVVDDASSDGSAAMIKAEFPDIDLIVNLQNVGFARANNLGARRARGRYVFLLNNDTILLNNAIGILAGYLDRNPDAGACGGLLLNQDLSTQLSYGNYPSFFLGLIDAFFLNDLLPGLNLPKRGIAPRSPIRLVADVDYISGADIMIRASLINSIGLFDEYFREYCEEVDFCFRARHTAHVKVAFIPEARIIHLGGLSYGLLKEGYIRKQFASYHKFLTKHHGKVYSFFTRLLYGWHYAIKFLVRTVRALAAVGEERMRRVQSARMAWYMTRYSLAPEHDSQ